jgi:hypothetical protein
MSNRNLKHSLRSTLASLALASSLTGVVAACSADAPTVTQVPSSISVQAPEAATAEGLSFYYDGVKTSVTIKDAAVLFAACTLKTSDTTKIVGFVNNTLKAGPIKDSDVTGLGDPLKPAISDFTGDGTVDCKDAAVLFAVATLGAGAPADKVNGFLSGTLKLPGVKRYSSAVGYPLRDSTNTDPDAHPDPHSNSDVYSFYCSYSQQLNPSGSFYGYLGHQAQCSPSGWQAGAERGEHGFHHRLHCRLFYLDLPGGQHQCSAGNCFRCDYWHGQHCSYSCGYQ